MMQIIKLTQLNETQKEQIFDLWNTEYPEKLVYHSMADFESYLSRLTEQNHYVLSDTNDKIKGWAITFIRENEKWFAIIISGKLHGKGIGTEMLNELKKNESILNGWVIDHNSDKKHNGDRYRSPLEFYIKNGFKVIRETRLELEVMSAVKIKWIK
ncbi:GNAT family N-acetyltransferase [Myroides ceti]|uniref:GNAT family N-acetyltransferase n=1 Tax=Paenimyroides ceti TaxID=395087 RepID=A0ABT8CQU7_9FLAO|nr:GNAT family N-acetyltransferase [Paenimyroides ceti]MDN3706559.1 GNAT family N-acetyltransferase [Paenimyroides ceti]